MEADEAGLSSATVVTNVGIEAEAESPTTQLYDGFTDLFPSSYYDDPKTLLGRHSSIFDTDFNFDDHYKLGYECNLNLNT